MLRPLKRNRPARDADADILNSPWYPYLHAYLDWMAFSGYAAGTLRTARHDLRMFVRWCDTRALTAPTQLSRPVLEQYQRHLFLLRKADGQPLAGSAQLHRLQHMKSFCRWLVRENLLPSNPASDLMLPRALKRLPRSILSIEEVEQILAQPDTATPVGLRDRALMELLYSTGIRRLELVKLHSGDLDPRRRLLLVREGKGGKDRYVPVGERALYWIGRYLDEAREELALPGILNLFVSDYGDELNDGVLSVWVKRHMERAGVKKTGSCHLFRHAMATHMLENGADIRFIQAMLGHANLTTTQIYTFVSIDKLQQIHAATHPAKLERTEETAVENVDCNDENCVAADVPEAARR
jgi:integrase/recombinase XerD